MGDNTPMIIGAACCCLFFCVIVSLWLYFKTDIIVEHTTTPAPTTPAPTTTAFPTTTPAATTTPAPYTLSKDAGSYYMNASNEYTCSGSSDSKYCTFNTQDDASKQCDKDPDCIGFGKTVTTGTTGTTKYQLASIKKKPTLLTGDNTWSWYKKPSSNPVYISTSTEKVKINKEGIYTCPSNKDANINDNYCNFNTYYDASKHCDSDPNCIGFSEYKDGSTQIFQAVSHNITEVDDLKEVTTTAANHWVAYYKKPTV
jgi:hypothetical protein